MPVSEMGQKVIDELMRRYQVALNKFPYDPNKYDPFKVASAFTALERLKNDPNATDENIQGALGFIQKELTQLSPKKKDYVENLLHTSVDKIKQEKESVEAALQTLEKVYALQSGKEKPPSFPEEPIIVPQRTSAKKPVGVGISPSPITEDTKKIIDELTKRYSIAKAAWAENNPQKITSDPFKLDANFRGIQELKNNQQISDENALKQISALQTVCGNCNALPKDDKKQLIQSREKILDEITKAEQKQAGAKAAEKKDEWEKVPPTSEKNNLHSFFQREPSQPSQIGSLNADKEDQTPQPKR